MSPAGSLVNSQHLPVLDNLHTVASTLLPREHTWRATATSAAPFEPSLQTPAAAPLWPLQSHLLYPPCLQHLGKQGYSCSTPRGKCRCGARAATRDETGGYAGGYAWQHEAAAQLWPSAPMRGGEHEHVMELEGMLEGMHGNMRQ
eukprot:1141300-Pelagomonas_calceolata.AAC.3